MNLLRPCTAAALLCAGLLGSAPAPATADNGALREQLAAIFADEKFHHAHWGVQIETLDGEVLYEINGGRSFIPASNQKLFTTAAALDILGPDYTYETQVYALGPVVDGVLKGDLLVVGSGDPSLGAWHPETNPSSSEVLGEWTAAVKEAGIEEIAGRVIGDGRYFNEEYINTIWWYWDLPYWYAAGSSGLAMEENCFRTTIMPGNAVGDPAYITWNPPTEYITVVNDVKTVEAGGTSNADIVWRSEENQFRYDRTIAIDKVINERGSVWDGTRYAAFLFMEELQRQGVAVSQGAHNILSVDDPEALDAADRRLLATYTSPPLRDLCSVINEVSHNFFADQVFRTLGKKQEGEGGWDASSKALQNWVREKGAPDPDNYQQEDGSGLASTNYLQPRQMTWLLRHMRTEAGEAGQAFYDSLSTGGKSGWLKNRYQELPEGANVRAKTGYISGSRALSGYVTNTAGEERVFSIICNLHTLRSRDVDAAADAAVTLLAE